MLTILVVVSLAMILVLGCGPTAAPAPPVAEAQPAPTMDTEALRSLVHDAVQSAATDSADPEEIKAMVEDAVAAGSSPGVTSEELQASVERAVSEALAAQEEEREASMAAKPEPDSIILTDIAGRTVTIDMPVERIILGEARQIYIAAALQPGNPFNKVVGWRSDLRQFDADTYNKYLERYPKWRTYPNLGAPTAATSAWKKPSPWTPMWLP